MPCGVRLWDKALAYCRQAGEKALARSVHREAVGYFEQALGALLHLPETRDPREQAIDLRLALRSALNPLGDRGRILAYLREAEALADPRRLGQVLVFLSNHFRSTGVYDQAITAGQRALALATAGGDVALQRWRTCTSASSTRLRASIIGRSIVCSRPWCPSTEGGAMSAWVRPTCRPCCLVPTSPGAMPSEACSLRAVLPQKRDSRLPRWWVTLAAS
jgi:tetratricopeptide (TPR) repeat protein